MADQTARNKVRAAFDRAVGDDDMARAEGIALAASLLDPGLDLKRRADNSADFTQQVDDEEYAAFCRAAGVEGWS